MDATMRIGRRREWLVGAGIATMIAAALAVIGVFLVAAMRNTPTTTIGQLSEFPIGVVQRIEFDTTFVDPQPPSDPSIFANKRDKPLAILVTRPNTDSVFAFYGRDPKSGCALDWLPDRQLIADRCYGTAYTIDGTYRSGPPLRNLDRFEVKISPSGTLSIDPDSFTLGDPIR